MSKNILNDYKNISNKKKIIIFLVIIMIFATSYLVTPLAKKIILERDQYTLDTVGMHRSHPPMFKFLWPTWKYDNVSEFFIHPSSTVIARGVLP